MLLRRPKLGLRFEVVFVAVAVLVSWHGSSIMVAYPPEARQECLRRKGEAWPLFGVGCTDRVAVMETWR